MLGNAAISLLIVCSLVAAGDFQRKGAKAQREFGETFAPLRLCVENASPQNASVTVDVFPVLDLPLTVHEAALVKTDKGYFLKLSLGNSSELAIVGLRYSLATINSENHVQIRVNRTEGFSIPAYATKPLTFKTPIRLKLKDGERLVLMLEQVVSRESIWEVVKAKEALEAYANGDYSVRPAVMRVPNQVDVPTVPAVMPRRLNEE
jgi:hypothetical protein